MATDTVTLSPALDFGGTEMEWRAHWPAIDITGTEWGETMGGGSRLDVMFTLAGRDLIAGEYEGGPIFDPRTGQAIDIYDLAAELGIDEDEQDDFVDALSKLGREFDMVLTCATSDYMLAARDATCRWLTGQLALGGVLNDGGQRRVPEDPWEEDPRFTVASWTYEVTNGDTRRGYRDWVRARYEAEADDAAEVA